MCKESNLRSLIKGVSWRFIATVTTMIIVYFFTKELRVAIVIGIIETILKILLFWLHERVWHKIKWGKSEKSDMAQ